MALSSPLDGDTDLSFEIVQDAGLRPGRNGDEPGPTIECRRAKHTGEDEEQGDMAELVWNSNRDVCERRHGRPGEPRRRIRVIAPTAAAEIGCGGAASEGSPRPSRTLRDKYPLTLWVKGVFYRAIYSFQGKPPRVRRFMSESDFTSDVLDPEPSILIESLRDIGYSFNSALADIIDNSVSANATSIEVVAIPDDNFYVGIIDNGYGMNPSELRKAMRLGSSSPRDDRDPRDLGRFGLGMKTASFSQCRRLTVASRCEGALSAFTWDLDIVVKDNIWKILERHDFENIRCLEHLTSDGTLVLWEKVDRLVGERGTRNTSYYSRVISDAQRHLSLVFHRFLTGETGLPRIDIAFNGRRLEPIDPFNSRHKATQVQPFEVVCPGVTMQAFTLPHKSHYKSQQDYDRYGLHGGYLKNQGVYLYRAKRLILYGTWFGIAKKTALTQLTRVKIDIGVDQDEQWKIDVKKVSAQMPEIVRDRIKTLISSIGAPSKRTYRRRAVRLTSPDVYPAWTVEKSGEQRIYRINRDNPVISALIADVGEDNARALEAVLSLIESSFPTESLIYDFENNAEGVTFEPIADEEFSTVARAFFSQLKQRGLPDESVLSIMNSAEPFASNWNKTLGALGVREN